MRQQSNHLDIASAIDRHVSNDSLDAITRTPEGKYQPWYSRLLSSAALLAADENVVFAYSDYEPTMTDVHIVVFTTNLVLIAEVDPDADGVPVAHATSRRSLVSMKLSASERIDAQDRRAYDWPGTLNLELTYYDRADPIEIVADGANRYAVDKPSPIVTLIEGLSADLASSRSVGRPGSRKLGQWRIRTLGHVPHTRFRGVQVGQVLAILR